MEPHEAFLDQVGQATKVRLFNYVHSKFKKPPKDLEAAIERTANIVAVTREATIEALRAESELLIFKQAYGEPIPTLFVSGVLHALDVIQGKGSIMDI